MYSMLLFLFLLFLLFSFFPFFFILKFGSRFSLRCIHSTACYTFYRVRCILLLFCVAVFCRYILLPKNHYQNRDLIRCVPTHVQLPYPFPLPERILIPDLIQEERVPVATPTSKLCATSLC
ncbi:hypothetical protein B0T13DRAFT_456355 [Neurospora crassa]|nr:hypothetical protein B0T13DRAFT_456355 [Neurospora crassa]